jgi:hypothetical protein
MYRTTSSWRGVKAVSGEILLGWLKDEHAHIILIFLLVLTKLIIKMVLETDRLPSIVSEFLPYSDTLRNLIQKATWEIMEDIKSMLYDYESKDALTYSWKASSHALLVARWLGRDQMTHQYQYHDELRTVRADQACRYLLETSSFVKWYDAIDNFQQLVLVGDMGCGKTVAMSFLVDILKRRNQGRLPEPKLSCDHVIFISLVNPPPLT